MLSRAILHTPSIDPEAAVDCLKVTIQRLERKKRGLASKLQRTCAGSQVLGKQSHHIFIYKVTIKYCINRFGIDNAGILSKGTIFLRQDRNSSINVVTWLSFVAHEVTRRTTA